MGTAEKELPRIGISCGDLNGISLEVILQTFNDTRMLELCTPVLFASAKVVSYHRKVCNLMQFHFQQIKSAKEAHSGKFNVVNLWDDEVNIQLGEIDLLVGKRAVDSLQAALEACDKGEVQAVVTGPIHKAACYDEKTFPFHGHTGYLASRYQSDAIMMLMDGDFRVALFTDHIPISKVADHIKPDVLEAFLRRLIDSMIADFGIRKPRVAVLGLNPHAGDEGLIGNEDQENIAPVVAKLREENQLVFGPFAADGFFGKQQHQQFDVVVAMYHDQGLAPFKALSFGGGVNISLGLPVVRTSPDHGTGFDIAGKNEANEESFRQAVFAALDTIQHRSLHKDLQSNVLKSQYKHRRGDR
ncbi:MAG: 4-hydroxythreonine-4-phosphate dehydrogenase PdxA [Flavobacteriales bacterium]|nr:MAG: 4-hydroxythreonine-4-phosphate dehydrogenase PdxA [Flavobacteriales bacterium]